MKKIATITLLFFVNLLATNFIMAQDRERFELTTTIEAQGKKITTTAMNANYSADSKNYNPYIKKDSIAEDRSFYGSVSAKYTSELMALLGQSSTINVTIMVKDKFGKNATRKYEFKDANFQFSESLNTFNDDYSSFLNLSLTCKSIIVDGIVFKH